MGVDASASTSCSSRSAWPARPPRKRVRSYSLGMRQRLGIAHALLGDPQVLILDEPANGLDPEGICWMRGLLRDFADRGGTVLLSSHLLREVEAIADQLVVIGGGRVVAQGPRRNCWPAPGRCPGARPAALHAALAAPASASRPPDGALVRSRAGGVGRVAADVGVVLLELRPADGGGLEELFLPSPARRPPTPPPASGIPGWAPRSPALPAHDAGHPRGGHPMSAVTYAPPLCRRQGADPAPGLRPPPHARRDAQDGPTPDPASG